MWQAQVMICVARALLERGSLPWRFRAIMMRQHVNININSCHSTIDSPST